MRSFETIRVRREGAVAVVSMARSEKRNAMNSQMVAELHVALAEQEETEAVAAVVLTGEGSAFSAGADRGGWEGLTAAELARVRAEGTVARALGGVILQVVAMSKPVVAAINGPAVGGGLILAISCDLRIAAQDAQFWMPEAGMGRAIGTPSLETLLLCTGPLVAKDIVLTGRRFSAADLERCGLVSQILPAHDVLAAALQQAHALTTCPPGVMSSVKSRANATMKQIWERSMRD